MEPIEENPDPIIATSIMERSRKKENQQRKELHPLPKRIVKWGKSQLSPENITNKISQVTMRCTISPEKNTKAVQTDIGPEKAIVRAQLESKILRHSIIVNNCRPFWSSYRKH